VPSPVKRKQTSGEKPTVPRGWVTLKRYINPLPFNKRGTGFFYGLKRFKMEKTILVIDDEETTQRLLGRILRKQGFTVLRASNGKEGLEILKAGNVDLIILDILMPVMDGFTFYKELKQDEVTQHIPVLVLTVRKRMEDSFMALGAEGFIGKPFERERLLTAIKTIFNEDDGTMEGELKQKESEIESSAFQNTTEPNSISSDAQTQKLKFKKMGSKNILVAGASEAIVGFMAEKLKSQGCTVHVAMTGQTAISKALEFKPDILLLEVNLDGISPPEIINALKKDDTVHTQILLYSYFLTPEREKTSIVNAYYTNQFEHNPNDHNHENHPVYYFGAFHRNSFVDRIKKFISYSF
jgi:CheY-like chemotaxis protein